MTSTRLLLCAGLLTALILNGIPSGSALAGPAPASSSFSIQHLPSWMEAGWAQYKAQRSGGQLDQAANTLDQIKKQSADEGIQRFDLFSAVLVQEGEELLSQGKRDGAIERGLEAQKWSPDNPAVSFFLARAFSYQHPIEALHYYFEGLSDAVQDFWFSFYFLGRLVIIGLAGIIGSFLLFALFLFIRYLPLLSHSLSELKILDRYAVWGVVAILLATPLLIGAGPGFVLLIGLCLFWFLMTWNERFVSAAFVVIVSLANLWLAPMLSWFVADQSGELTLLSHVIQGHASAVGSIRAVEEQATREQDWLVLSSLALQNKREGNYPKALELYQKAQTLEPDQPILQNNMGNIYFLTKQYDPAIAAYKQALTKNPQSVTAHYNLNVVYSELLRFEDAKQQYEQAQQINLPVTQSYADRGKVVVDELFPKAVLWERAFYNSPLKKERSRELFEKMFMPVTLKASQLLAVIFLAGLAVMRLVSSKKYVASRCALCAQPICFHCQRRLFDLKTCHNCWTMSKTIKRKADLRQIRIRQHLIRRATRILSIFLPGTGQFYLRHTMRGFVFLAIFFGILFTVIFHNWFLRAPGEYGSVFGLGSGLLITLVLVALYVLVFYDLQNGVAERS